MHDSFIHINSNNETFDFLANHFLINYNELRDWEWSYTQNDDGSYLFDRKDKSISLPLIFKCSNSSEAASLKNNFYKHFDIDTMSNKPGYFVINGYKLAANIVKNVKSNYLIDDRYLEIKLDIIKQSYWTKETTKTFISESTSNNVTNSKKYDYTYPYVYVNHSGYSDITNTSYFDSDCLIRIYGAALNPFIMIGNNVYQVNLSIDKNEIIEIDTDSRTIKKITSKGDIVDAFNYRDKTYNTIFNKITPGTNIVSWDASFSFDVVLFDKRNEPAWEDS